MGGTAGLGFSVDTSVSTLRSCLILASLWVSSYAVSVLQIGCGGTIRDLQGNGESGSGRGHQMPANTESQDYTYFSAPAPAPCGMNISSCCQAVGLK